MNQLAKSKTAASVFTRRWAQWAFVALILCYAGCVQLCDQRVTMRYDRESDTFYILLNYDGVHDSGSDQWGKGVDQLAKFVAGGEFMLFDWPLHIQLEEIRKRLADSEVSATERTLDKAIVEQVRIESIGRYRDALNRVGGAQLITITKASVLVRAINTAINSEIRRNNLADVFPADANLSGTRQRMLAAAEKDHQWLAIEGNALRLSVPVHEQEWTELKANGIFALLNEAHEQLPDELEARTKETFAQISRVLANVPFAYGESDGIVTFRVGDPARPTTIRAEGLNKYEDNLEAELEQLVTQEVDPFLARQLAGEQSKPPSAGLKALAEWGPPEERVRAMARATEVDDKVLVRKARFWLTNFSAEWNRNRNRPPMPTPSADDNNETIARAYFQWCREVREFPNPNPPTGAANVPANLEQAHPAER